MDALESVHDALASVDDALESVDDALESVDDAVQSVDDALESVDDSLQSVRLFREFGSKEILNFLAFLGSIVGLKKFEILGQDFLY